LLSNGKTVVGCNQENASYPVGICAERALLASAGCLFPEEHIITLALSYHNMQGSSTTTISPCGMCRQALVEHETRYKHAIRLILGGESGKVYIVPRASLLLPLQFTDEFLKHD
jgi:cytidine deaminase